MAMETKARMTTFLFKEFFSFLINQFLKGIFPSNQYLLILDGHSSHVTLETTKQTQQLGLDMVTLHSYTSHVL
jgi:hypothetical protein